MYIYCAMPGRRKPVTDDKKVNKCYVLLLRCERYTYRTMELVRVGAESDRVELKSRCSMFSCNKRQGAGKVIASGK